MKLLESVYKENIIDESTHSYYIDKVSLGKVTQILYHEPSGDGDQRYVVVYFEFGSTMRIFRPDDIEFLTESV